MKENGRGFISPESRAIPGIKRLVAAEHHAKNGGELPIEIAVPYIHGVRAPDYGIGNSFGEAWEIVIRGKQALKDFIELNEKINNRTQGVVFSNGYKKART